ncbi:MAG: hypothetical protein AAB722_01610 [Patescibacteria group bacterium]|mgnify:CR=1 FL=1
MEEITLEDLQQEGLEEEDIENAKINRPEKSDFPWLTVFLAVFKDISDIPGELLTFGLWGTVTNIIAAIVIFIYLYGRVGFVKKRLYRKYIFTVIIEFIPFINWIPQNAFFVMRAHATENEKLDKLFNYLENLAKGKIKK